MLRRLILAALLLLVPALAEAETCTTTANGIWSAIGSLTTTGCTASVDDTFVINHFVIVQADPALTTGGIDVGATGYLYVPPGETLQYGDGTAAAGNPASVGIIVREGGILHTEGGIIRSCRIESAPNWSAAVAATHQVSAVLDCDLTGVTTSHFVFFGDEDPENLDGTLTRGCVQAGPGRKVGGCHRWAGNKWASYPIDVIDTATRTLTWDIDSQAGAYTGTPYAGSRYAPAAGAITRAQITTVTPRWLQRRTNVTIDVAYSAGVALIAADRGSWYLQADEDPTLANAPDSCQGLAFKVLHATDGGAGADTLELQGDFSRCKNTSDVFRLTTGARRGDLVHIYSPATLNGNTDGGVDVVGEGGIAFLGGHWLGRFTRLVQPGAMDATSFSPAIVRNANLGFYQGASATEQPSFDLDWIEVAYPATLAASPATDVAVIHFAAALNGDEVRYTAANLNVTRSRARRLHIHDSLNNTVGGGGHGIYIDTAYGVDVAQVRIERINDDCLGALNIHSDTTPTIRSSLKLRQGLIYECISSTDNSQQGIELQVENEGTDATNPGLSTDIYIADVLSMGHYTTPLLSQSLGGEFRGITTGGGFSATGWAAVSLRWASTGDQGGHALGIVESNLVRVKDSNLYVFGPTTVATPIIVGGEVSGSFVAGFDVTGVVNSRPSHMGRVIRSVFDLSASSDASGYMLVGGGTATNNYQSPLFENSIIRSTRAAAGRLATGLVDTAGAPTPTIRRLGLLVDAPQAAPNGVLQNFSNAAGMVNATTLIDGFFVSASGAATAADVGTAGTGTTYTTRAACFESTSATDTPFGSSQGRTAQRLTAPADLKPDADDALVLRALLGKPDSEGCLARNLPLELGYEKFRVSHGMLGDGEILGVANSSSDDLIRVVGGWSHQSPPSGMPGSH